MMNKFGFALGVATVATLTGCLDPNWVQKHPRNAGPSTQPGSTHVSNVPTEPDDVPVTPVDVPGGHKVVVEDEPVTPPPATIVTLPPPPPPPPPATVEQTTTYIVQRGDTLSKISKKFNIKIDAIKAKNPQIKGDTIKLGQKLTLPGAVEVGEQKVPEGAFASSKPAATASSYKPYSGATKEYVVKQGDTLGAIAHSCGIGTRQLKEMNGLEKDVIRVNQKLVVPAEKVAAATPAVKRTDKKTEEKKPVVEKPAVEPKSAVEPAEPTPPAQDVLESAGGQDVLPAVEPQPQPEAAADYFIYTVKDGEDITGISINYDVSPSEIRQLNNLADDAQVTGGMELKLPLSAQR